MKFDFVIGNPPYQEQTIGDNKGFAPPVYDKFIDGAMAISDKVELIHPARFLFNAGSTPKAWNEKMLDNSHFKVLRYEENASNIFSNTDIKGGVAISYYDKSQNFGKIGVFTKHKELNGILKKVYSKDKFASLTSIIHTQTKFDLDKLYADYPDAKNIIGSGGADKRLRNNIFEKIELFTDAKTSRTDVAILGVEKNKRTTKYIHQKYIDQTHGNLNDWKVLVVRVNGSGEFGGVLSTPFLSKPHEGYTQTYIGIGAFENAQQAENALKYVKTKFCRAMLSILKVTQDNSRDTWKYVPLEDFSSNGEINWGVDVSTVDRQLYKKYGLTEGEISFIEANVKEME